MSAKPPQGYDDEDDGEEDAPAGALPFLEDDGAEIAPEQVLLLVPRFAAQLKAVRWFSAVGQKIEAPVRELSARYLDALGFPDCTLAPISDWREAEEAAESTGVDLSAFDAEEQLRMALEGDALSLCGEDALSVAFAHIQSIAVEAAREGATNAARMWGVPGDDVIAAAVGAAVQAAHEAGLLLLSGRAEEDHPFALKFALFERGRWPIGVTGMSFNVF